METVSFALLILSLCVAVVSSSAHPPNILFVLADDLGFGNIGYNSPQNTEIHTPNIDRLATKEGLRLTRHYVHYVCSPTRTSLQTGRLPVHVNLNNVDAASTPYSGSPVNMTLISEKLKHSAANYSTHFIGKWDAGSSRTEQLPVYRGYDTFFGYLSHGITYFNAYEWAQPCVEYGGQQIHDLWRNEQPASASEIDNTTYIELQFADSAYAILRQLDNTSDADPFFMVYASHLSHDPLQISAAYYDIFDDDESECSQQDPFIYPQYNGTYHCRSVVQSMVNLLDKIVGNMTDILKTRNLWDNTLVIFTGDNGGCQLLNVCGGNNHPLRGGKMVPFEGGIRTATFVSGGYLPSERFGLSENGMVHIADWYHTFCALNGIDATDYKALAAGLPPIDGYNVWDLITGKNQTSPRREIAVDQHVLIRDEYKLMINATFNFATWNGVIFPNSSSVNHSVQHTTLNCSNGCLFNVVDDYTEHVDISAQNPQMVRDLNDRLVELQSSFYSNDERGTDLCPADLNMSCVCWMALNRYDGFYGPYQTLSISE